MDKKVLSFQEFFDIMFQNSGKGIEGVIVYKESNFKKQYSLESRSYKVNSDAKYFSPSAGGDSLYGSALDGSDPCVRLERIGWDIDYCYIL